MAHDTTAHHEVVDVVTLEDAQQAQAVVKNIAALSAVPLDVLPPGRTRDALFTLVEDGHDLSAVLGKEGNGDD